MELRPEDLEKVEFKAVDDGGVDSGEVKELLQRAAERIRALEQEGVRAVGGTVAEMLDQAVKSSEELTAQATADAGTIRETAEAAATTLEGEAAAAKAEAEADRATAAGELEEARAAATSEAEQLVTDAKGEAEQLAAAATSEAEQLVTDAKGESDSIIEEAGAVAAKQITDAEHNAAEKLEAAESAAASLVEDAERSAIERSTLVINESQQRLDRLLAAERDVHDRLQAAMADIQTSVSRVGVDQTKELALTIEDPDPSAGDEARWADDPAPDEVSARRRSA